MSDSNFPTGTDIFTVGVSAKDAAYGILALRNIFNGMQVGYLDRRAMIRSESFDLESVPLEQPEPEKPETSKVRRNISRGEKNEKEMDETATSSR